MDFALRCNEGYYKLNPEEFWPDAIYEVLPYLRDSKILSADVDFTTLARNIVAEAYRRSGDMGYDFVRYEILNLVELFEDALA